MGDIAADGAPRASLAASTARDTRAATHAHGGSTATTTVMKGQAKRFLDHKGRPYAADVTLRPAPASDRRHPSSLGFFDLWRYSSWREVAATCAGAALGVVAALGLVGAVLVYGELTALFVARVTARATPAHARLLRAAGGARRLPAGDRAAHAAALLEDARAFALASLAIMTVQLGAAAAAVTLANWAAGAAVARLRRRLLRALLAQEMAFFDTNTDLNFATILTEDMEKVREGIGEHVAMTAYLGGTVVCGSTLALCYGWQLTLAGLAVVPLSIGVAAVVARRQTAWAGEEVRAYGAAGRLAEQALAGVRTVRAFAGEREETRRYAAALGGAARATRARALWAGAGSGLGWLLTYSLNAVVFAYGAALCVRDRDLPPDDQEYHPGIMVTVLFCTFMAAQNVTMCQPHLEVFSSARGAARAIFEVLERKSKIDALGEGGGGERLRLRGEVTFENVYFNYESRADVKVLRGLSLTVRAGETVALVGSSGCGKSTVLQLLQRLYEPDAGTVRVDGIRLQDLPLHAYRTSIGVVGQEPVLFSGTIRENITLGLEDVSEEEVVAAAETAHAHRFITELPQGYETMVGEGGAALSGGQKQRVAIARAVLRHPALLLLDEPTSALDPEAERVVQAALEAAARHRTTLLVSHRLATVVSATRILYMEQGCVLEEGTHDELLARRGAYWRLVQDDLTAGAARAPGDAPPSSAPPAPRDDHPFPRTISRQSSTFIRGSIGGAAVRCSRRMGAVPSAPEPTPDVDEGEGEGEGAVGWWQLLRLQGAEWPLLAGGGVAAFLVGTTMPAFAFLFSKLYGMFAWPDGEAILAASRLYAGLFLGAAALCGVVTFLQAWLFNVAGARLTARLRLATFAHYLRQEQAWFDAPANSVGALGARLAADCAAVQGATGTRLGTVLQGISTMVIGVALAMAFSWKMTLVSLLSVPCVIGGIYLESYVNKRTEERERRALEKASRLATEAALHVRTVQALGVERVMLSRYAAALREARGGAGGGARCVRGPVYGLCLCAPTLGYTVSLAYGGYLIAAEDLPYEYAILVSEALIYGAWMLAEALSFAPSFAAARRSGARILAALARQPRVASAPAAAELPAWSAEGEVTLTDVTFRYPSAGGGRPALDRLTLRAAPGETLALVGPSGCGKSTVLNLLLRNYDPDAGRVELDGRDVREALTLRQLRAQLGLVQQEPVLFERTLRENIAYGDTSREVPLEEVVEAAKQAHIHAFIVGLPQGYETVVGGGAALSGGQKQRVAIARALVRRPRVLLLDEATSALDAGGERAVSAALAAAARHRTTVVVAHRLATVRHAHRIAVLAAGRLAEQGDHDTLMRARGAYYRLWHQQHPPEP